MNSNVNGNRAYSEAVRQWRKAKAQYEKCRAEWARLILLAAEANCNGLNYN